MAVCVYHCHFVASQPYVFLSLAQVMCCLFSFWSMLMSCDLYQAVFTLHSCKWWVIFTKLFIESIEWEDGGGGHWLVRMEWHLAGWSVCLSLLISPCTIKSRSSLLAPAHPGGPGKRAVKWLWCGGGDSIEWTPLSSSSLLVSCYCNPMGLKTCMDHVLVSWPWIGQVQKLKIVIPWNYYFPFLFNQTNVPR